jgi:hypothetical protein
MSKKPVPGLMGNAKFLPGSSRQEVQVGARRFTRFVQPGETDLFQSVLDADSLFETAFGDFGVFVLEEMLQEAEFPEYPAIITVSERETIAKRFTGAAPNIDNPKDIPASLAWVLVQFSMAENLRQFYISSNNFGGVWSAGVRMGRLADWWVWRREGHDAEAVHGQKFPARKTGKATKARHRKSEDRAAHVIETAQRILDADFPKLRFADGRINLSRLARAVLRATRPGLKVDRIRQILREAVRGGKME